MCGDFFVEDFPRPLSSTNVTGVPRSYLYLTKSDRKGWTSEVSEVWYGLNVLLGLYSFGYLTVHPYFERVVKSTYLFYLLFDVHPNVILS